MGHKSVSVYLGKVGHPSVGDIVWSEQDTVEKRKLEMIRFSGFRK